MKFNRNSWNSPIFVSIKTSIITNTFYSNNNGLLNSLAVTKHGISELYLQYLHKISNGNRTEWSPIRSVIIRVITKSDDRAAGV